MGYVIIETTLWVSALSISTTAALIVYSHDPWPSNSVGGHAGYPGSNQPPSQGDDPDYGLQVNAHPAYLTQPAWGPTNISITHAYV